LGYKNLTATLKGIIVKIPDNTNGLVMERENSVPLLICSIIRVYVKTVGKAAEIPPRMGPLIWLKTTDNNTREPAPTPRKITS
jgi:hypothetical protein